VQTGAGNRRCWSSTAHSLVGPPFLELGSFTVCVLR